MWLLLDLALRNTIRSRSRSILTAVTVVVGTALLTLALAWIEGVLGDVSRTASDGTGQVRIVKPEFAAREELMPLRANLSHVEDLAAAVKKVPGVVEVAPRITTGVTLSIGDSIGDVFALAIGAPREFFQGRLHLGEHLAAGRLPEKDRGELVLGATTARQLEAKIGDEVVLLGQTQDGALSPIKGTVVGIASPGTGLVDQAAYVPLPAVQYLGDMDGAATELLVYGDDLWAADELADTLRAVPAVSDLEVQPWSSRDPWAGLLPIINAVKGILESVIVFVTALGVWNTMLMSVMERTDEIGVMRAMGLGRASAVTLFVTEALGIAAVGGLIGVAIGSIGALYLQIHGLTLGDTIAQNTSLPIQSTLYAQLSFRVVATSFGLGLCMALVGSALPSGRAAFIEPALAMRDRK